MHMSPDVPMVSCASTQWMPNQGNIKVIENVLRKAVAWILGASGRTHKKKW